MLLIHDLVGLQIEVWSHLSYEEIQFLILKM